MKTSASLQRIEQQLTTIEPGSLRHHVLSAARDFKTSWIALGRVLYTVWKERAYKQWHYLTFEAYCAKEIGIQALTAKKLLRSYAFLEHHEPRLLPTEEQPVYPTTGYPSYEAVDVLRQAKEQAQLPEAAYRQLRERVFERGEEAPVLRKELRLVMRRAQPTADAAAEETRAKHAALRRLVGTLRALHRTAAEEHLLSTVLLRDVQRLIERIEAVVREGASA